MDAPQRDIPAALLFLAFGLLAPGRPLPECSLACADN
jgi:hypothetical protein